MKNRKRIIVSFMIIACMLMAIGFAALTDTLNVNGDAEIDYFSANTGFDADVYFSSAVANDNGDSASISALSDDKAVFEVRSLTTKGDKATFTFTVQNDNDFTAYVKLNEDKNHNDNTEYFDCQISHTEFEIPAGGSVIFTVTVELLKVPQIEEGQKITATFGYELDVQDEAFN